MEREYELADALEKIHHITEAERLYPQMMTEFKLIQNEQYALFCKKMLNYGPSNIMLGGDVDNKDDCKVALSGLAIRVNDKSNRLINLCVKNVPDLVGESIKDTFQDLSVYGIIAQIVSRGKWAK